ncbi:MAG: lipoyl(octanoyl) transferase LipB [Anaerolineae bacterium]|nr:lipoyl(octanoyl) transferase LipB [Anaerolineae bacterium]
MAVLRVLDLGPMPYLEAWALQKQLAQERGADGIPDTLLLLEHPHTYTLGSAGHDEYILLSPDELAVRHIDVLRVDRGGDVTYHGPGQLVGYPILKLPPALDNLHADVIDYIRRLEQSIIAALAEYGIAGWPYAGLTGVWVGDHAAPAKICAIGVKITTRRVTLHGFALNVNTDLSYFAGIVPCGIHDKAVTSMQQVLRAPVDMTSVTAAVTRALAAEFGFDAITHD